MKIAEHVKNYIFTVIALVYLVVRFAFTSYLDSFGVYSTYILELTVVVVAVVIDGSKSFLEKLKVPAKIGFPALVALICGAGIYKLSSLVGIPIVFNLEIAETLVFLIIVAPILEEFIFRYLLWQPALLANARLASLIITSALFSYSHFHAIWFVPLEYSSFIYYQSAYTLFLGIACGFYVYRYNSLLGAILIHFAFNVGFYLGSLLS
jgi:membrane protease YdiL (CAAX protease family)